jgi:hypothetical protein
VQQSLPGTAIGISAQETGEKKASGAIEDAKKEFGAVVAAAN